MTSLAGIAPREVARCVFLSADAWPNAGDAAADAKSRKKNATSAVLKLAPKHFI